MSKKFDSKAEFLSILMKLIGVLCGLWRFAKAYYILQYRGNKMNSDNTRLPIAAMDDIPKPKEDAFSITGLVKEKGMQLRSYAIMLLCNY